MSATRLLILGVLEQRPMHGYDVRRELETWHAERWANVAYGSIYFGLGQMAREGLVEIVGADAPGRGPARRVYAITDRGRQELARLVHEYWWEVKPAIDPFQVALTFMDRLPRDELLAALRNRAHLMRSNLEWLRHASDAKLSAPGVPRHIEENLRRVAAQVEVDLGWIEGVLGKVERGELP